MHQGVYVDFVFTDSIQIAGINYFLKKSTKILEPQEAIQGRRLLHDIFFPYFPLAHIGYIQRIAAKAQLLFFFFFVCVCVCVCTKIMRVRL